MNQSRWRILTVDAAEGLDDIDSPGGPALIIFRWRALVLGARALLEAELPFRRDQALAAVADMIAEQVAARGGGLQRLPRAGVDGAPQVHWRSALSCGELLPTLDALAAPAAADARDLSVVICTRDRGAEITRCLDSLAAQEAPPGQVVVVDNSADGNARSRCEGRPGVAYIHEPSPGLSRARNAGVTAARGELVAFSDDDVEFTPSWTAELVHAFRDPSIDAVTGLVLPASLETPAQRAFELELGGFTSRYIPLLFDESFLAATRSMGPQVWRVGAGANMAFRRKVFARLGGFDERLGAGASGCSEDSEYWYRLLAAGGRCLYEPRAVVSHHHRAAWAGLRSQFRAYMRGHVSALVVQADRYGDEGNLRRIWRQLPEYFLRTAISAVQTLAWWRLRLLISEVAGWLEGVGFLLRPRWRRPAAPRPPRPNTRAAREIAHA